MKRYSIRAGVRDGVSQENDLYLRLRQAAAVDLLEHTNQGIESLGELAMAPAMLGTTLNAFWSCSRPGFEFSGAEASV